MNDLNVMNKWREIKTEIQNTWDKIAGEDLEHTKGDIAAIAELIGEEYDMKKDEIVTRLKDLGERIRTAARADVEAAEAAADSVKKQVTH